MVFIDSSLLCSCGGIHRRQLVMQLCCYSQTTACQAAAWYSQTTACQADVVVFIDDSLLCSCGIQRRQLVMQHCSCVAIHRRQLLMYMWWYSQTTVCQAAGEIQRNTLTGQKGANIYLLERKEDCSDYRKEIRMITTVTETARKLEETGIFSQLEKEESMWDIYCLFYCISEYGLGHTWPQPIKAPTFPPQKFLFSWLFLVYLFYQLLLSTERCLLLRIFLRIPSPLSSMCFWVAFSQDRTKSTFSPSFETWKF